METGVETATEGGLPANSLMPAVATTYSHTHLHTIMQRLLRSTDYDPSCRHGEHTAGTEACDTFRIFAGRGIVMFTGVPCAHVLSLYQLPFPKRVGISGPWPGGERATHSACIQLRLPPSLSLPPYLPTSLFRHRGQKAAMPKSQQSLGRPATAIE